jgi:hypothetical protein
MNFTLLHFRPDYERAAKADKVSLEIVVAVGRVNLLIQECGSNPARAVDHW